VSAPPVTIALTPAEIGACVIGLSLFVERFGGEPFCDVTDTAQGEPERQMVVRATATALGLRLDAIYREHERTED
jgi:hypothetical protein